MRGIIDHTQPKVVVSYTAFPWWLTLCKKTKISLDFFQRYWRSKNPAIWLNERYNWQNQSKEVVPDATLVWWLYLSEISKRWWTFFLSQSSLHRHMKEKTITITRYYFILPVPEKKGKNKLKQFEIEVKMIIKMKKHTLCSNWQTLIDLYEIFVFQNLKENHQII